MGLVRCLLVVGSRIEGSWSRTRVGRGGVPEGIGWRVGVFDSRRSIGLSEGVSVVDGRCGIWLGHLDDVV